MISTNHVALLDERKAGGVAFQGWTFFTVAIICAFGVSVKMYGYTIRPERVLVTIWLLIIIPFIPKYKPRIIPLLLLGWIALSLISSLMSAQPSSAFRHWVDLSLAVSFFFVCQMAPLHLLILRRPSALMWISMALGAGAILTGIVYAHGLNTADTIWANFVMDEGNTFRLKMTLLEPNLFGIAMSVFSLLSIAEFKKSEKWTWLPLVLSHAGLILAFSRGPFIGYVAGLVVYVIVTRDKGIYLKLLGAFFSMMVFLPWLGLPVNSGMVGYNDANFIKRQYTISVRVLAVKGAIPDIIKKPVMGNGIYSFSFLHPEFNQSVGASAEDQAWLSNLPVAILHDTGWVGLLLLSTFFTLVILRGYKATLLLRDVHDYPYVRRAAAWLGAAVSVLVVSLSTLAYSLSLFWGIFSVCYCIPFAMTKLKA